MEAFEGSIDDLLEKVSRLSEEEIDQIEADAEKSASISFICTRCNCTEEEAEEIYEYILDLEIKKALDDLIEEGLVKIVGYDEDGNPLYALKND